MNNNKEHCAHYWLEVSKPFNKEVEVEICSSKGIHKTVKSITHSTWECKLCSVTKDFPTKLENWYKLTPRVQGLLTASTINSTFTTSNDKSAYKHNRIKLSEM